MDERKQYVLVALALFMVLKHGNCIIDIQQIVMFEQNVKMMLMDVFILEGGQINTTRVLWKCERVGE